MTTLREHLTQRFDAQERAKAARGGTDQPQATQTVSDVAHNHPTSGSIPGPATPFLPGADQRPAREPPFATDSRAGASPALHHQTLRPPTPYEKDVQAAILELLELHPRVAWAARMNTGGTWRQNPDGTRQYIAFAFKGCSDILGQLRCGRLLAIEVKRPGKNPSPEQQAFLVRVNTHHGVGFVARSVDDVTAYLRWLP